jgi:CxxC-x17-CxxC domain-containing protein
MADKTEINFFGLTNFRNQKARFGIKTDDRRRHFYCIGKTGMGKSNLMENMAIQDIQMGHGLAYVDPHGEGAEKLLDFVPSSRINDVVFFNPADLDFPMAFNVMEKVDFRYRHLVAGGLMGVFKKVWPDVWSARMEYILNNAILALLEYPDATLLGVNRMLADPEYREKVVNNITDPIVKAFWTTEYSRYSQRYETEATAAIQNKVGQFISNPLIRNIIGQSKSTLDMRKIMDEQKIFIMDLSKGRIGEENSRLLGALLITKLQLAAMSRVDIPEADRKDFYLYVDEFQNFATESFAGILSEARKYRLCIILGHQYITQMDEIVRDAVFGNVGTMVVFRVGAEDAEFLEKEFSPTFMATDLVALPKYNVYLKLMIDGIAGNPFSALTLPPPLMIEATSREKIINASRSTYSVKREDVEKQIIDWAGLAEMGPVETITPTGSPLRRSLNERPEPRKNPAPVRSGSQAFSNASSDAPPTVLYDAVCANCGKNTKVIFPPEPGRPVYCKNCLKKMKAQGGIPKQMPSAPQQLFGQEVAIGNVAFNQSKDKDKKEKPKHREINLSELKKVLQESLADRDAEKAIEEDDGEEIGGEDDDGAPSK